MSVASPPGPRSTLVGRQAEIGHVDALLDHVRRQGGALLIRGEPGIGKSALLGYAHDRAGELGARTLSAVGVESEAQFPFAALHQLLRPLDRRMESLPSPQRQALDVAFGINADMEPDRFRVALAAFQLVCEAADSSPLVLIVDDAQWIDRSSLDAITFVARRLESEPVAVLAAVRDGFATSLDELQLPAIHLQRLEEAAAVELLDRNEPNLAGELRSRVLQEAAGNPLGLIELARNAQAGGDSRARPALVPLTLTARLEKTFAAQLNRLPDAARLALLASALDVNASIEEVLAAATLLHDGGPVGLDALEGAIATGYMAVAGTGLRFTHPLMRSAVEQTAPSGEVLAMRAALARVVSDPDRRLWHRAMSTLGRDEEIADALEGYARAARRRGALMVAASALERAAALTLDRQRMGECWAQAAEIAYELGLIDNVRRLLQRAEGLEVDKLAAARLAWLQQMISGDVWVQAGATKTFVTIAQQMLDGGDPDMALRSLVPIAHRCWWTRARTRTRQYLVDAAQNLPFPDTDPRLLAVIALAHPERTGLSVLRRVSSVRLHELADPVDAMYVGIAAEKAGDFAVAGPFLARAAERLREQGRLGMLTQALVHYAWTATHTGDWAAAAAAGAEAARLARDTRQPQFGLTGELIVALATALRGNEPDLEALLAKPERTLLGTNGGPLLAPAHIARGTAALGDGRQEDAFSDLWPIFDENDPAFHRFMRWSVVLDLVEAGGRGDHADRVLAVIAELEEIAGRSEPPILRVGLTCARPLLAGDDEAQDLFATAVGRDSMNYPFLRARTLFSFGCWLRRKRRSADSRAPLRDAVALFDALGAIRWSDRARHELRATGETIGHRTPDARDRLTAQELQIAQLAAQGLSNREIGERLFLSHRTIGSHLYRVFPKLEITARSQLRDALGAATD